MRMRVTVPSMLLTVTVSPTRMGCSKRRMMPEMKLAKISWRPKPMPRVMAAASHCTWVQPMPMALKAGTEPTMLST